MTHTSDPTDPPGRSAGIAILLATAVSAVLMPLHPRLHAAGMAEFVEKVAATAAANAAVHGGIVAALGLFVAGFACLAARLGGSVVSRAAMVAFAGGAAALAVAALVGGFAVPELVSRYRAATAEELEALRHVLGLSRAANQVFSRAGVTAVAVAVFLWSLLLVRRGGFTFAVGAAGVVVGASLVAGVVSGYLRMDLHGMLAFVAALGCWSVGVAVLMIRGRI